MVDTLYPRMGARWTILAASHGERPSAKIAQPQRLSVSLVPVCCWKHRSFLEICCPLPHSESLKTSVSAKGSAAATTTTTGQINQQQEEGQGGEDEMIFLHCPIICTETRWLCPQSSLCFFNQSSQDSSGKAHTQAILIGGKLM